jgi:hypothetical protein
MARLYLKKNKNKNKQSQKEWVVGHLPTKGDALSSNLSTVKMTTPQKHTWTKNFTFFLRIIGSQWKSVNRDMTRQHFH